MAAAPAPPRDLVLDAAEIAALPRQEFEVGHPGVTVARVWEKDDSYAGVMWIASGEHVPAHMHRQRAHHVWVAEGRCKVLGRELGPGSYWYIAAGDKHGIEGAGPNGCTLFYLFIAER